MRFPFNKEILLNNSSTEFLENYSTHTEIPLAPHPGSFAFERKNHIHEGVDLYCEEGDAVFAIEAGIVLDIFSFTGSKASPASPWWHDTQAILIQSKNYTYNYGEIAVSPNLKIGQTVNEGDILGQVKMVLKKDKGRPRTMLHLELYTPETTQSIPSWNNNMPRPANLLDPTDILLQLYQLKNKKTPHF